MTDHPSGTPIYTTTPPADGGPAFPHEPYSDPTMVGHPFSVPGHSGMSLRDYYAAHAPITYEMACRVFGSDPAVTDLAHEQTRASFFAVWALMKQEFADTMIWQREQS